MIQYFLDYSFLFLTKFVPSSFPFLLFSSLLIQYGITDILPGKSAFSTVFLLSLISGFPSGAIYTRDLLEENVITKEEGNKILFYSHFPNPLFVLGSVRLVLNEVLSRQILLTIFLSNFLIFLFFRKRNRNIYYRKNINNCFSKILSNSIFSTSKTILLVYGTSLFFYLFFAILTKYIVLPSYLFVFLAGLFDLTNGVFSSSIISSLVIRAYFILFFISFGGISIHMQIKGILEDTPLSYRFFFLGRIIGTVLSFLIFSFLVISHLLQS